MTDSILFRQPGVLIITGEGARRFHPIFHAHAGLDVNVEGLTQLDLVLHPDHQATGIGQLSFRALVSKCWADEEYACGQKDSRSDHGYGLLLTFIRIVIWMVRHERRQESLSYVTEFLERV